MYMGIASSRHRLVDSLTGFAPWLLGRTGIEDGRLASIRAYLLVRALLFVLAFDAAKQFLRRGHTVGAILCGASLLFGLAIRTKKSLRPAATLACAAIATTFVVVTFPTTANHGYATWLLCVTALWIQRLKGQDRMAGLALARWLAAIIMFWSGAQKLLHGTYDHGEFLASQIAVHAQRFAGPLSVVISEADLAHLVESQAGSGTFEFTSWQALSLSRAIPIAELLLGVGLLFGTTRLAAAWVAALFVLAIQLVAGEITFAMVMLGVLSTFYPARQMAAISDVITLVFIVAAALALSPIGVDAIN